MEEKEEIVEEVILNIAENDTVPSITPAESVKFLFQLFEQQQKLNAIFQEQQLEQQQKQLEHQQKQQQQQELHNQQQQLFQQQVAAMLQRMEARDQEHKDSFKEIRLEQERRDAEIKQQQEDQELRQKRALEDVRNDILRVVSAELQEHRQAVEDLTVEDSAPARVVFEVEDDTPSMAGLYRDRVDPNLSFFSADQSLNYARPAARPSPPPPLPPPPRAPPQSNLRNVPLRQRKGGTAEQEEAKEKTLVPPIPSPRQRRISGLDYLDGDPLHRHDNIKIIKEAPLSDHIRLEKLTIRNVQKFFEDIHMYKAQNQGLTVKASKFIPPDIITTLVAATDDPRVNHLSFYGLSNASVGYLMRNVLRPLNKNDFYEQLINNLSFQLPKDYSPSAIDFKPLYDTFITYRYQFEHLYEFLSEENLSNTPFFDDKEGGIIKAFLSKIPDGLGKRMHIRMRKDQGEHGRYSSLEAFLKPFYN
jgi:hypothetical protein